MNLIQKVEKRMKDYPPYSQSSTSNPLIVMKLFHAFGSGTWYLTEYDPETKIAFGYVTGLEFNEWGSISIEELAKLTFAGVPRIEVDRHFEKVRFRALHL